MKARMCLQQLFLHFV